MRRSQRLTDQLDRRPPVECITLGSSSDDDDEVSITAEIISPLRPPKRPVGRPRKVQPQTPRAATQSQPSRPPPPPSSGNQQAQARQRSASQTRQTPTASQPRRNSSSVAGSSLLQQTTPLLQPTSGKVPPDGGQSAPDTSTKSPQPDDPASARVQKRRLTLEKIVGAVKAASGVDFVVKWRGLSQLERIALADLRRFFPQQVLEYLFEKIRWTNPTVSQAAVQLSPPSQNDAVMT